MSKQKIVIKFANDNKTRSKAMKTAVRISGVESVSLKEGQIEVTGVGVDAAELANCLRESFGETSCCVMKTDGYAEIVSVTPVKKLDDNNKDKEKEKENLCKNLLYKDFQFGYPSHNPMYVAVDQLPYNHPNSCFIL
ncbi:hypothetical protein M5689_018485 [Euphorbia peplus]|nr:hypothetical protein M5689_018485 [Euphorbia peplus]